MADGHFVDVGGLEEVSGDPVEERDVGRSVVLAGTAEILIQMNVQHPVQAVFDLPVGSRKIERLLR